MDYTERFIFLYTCTYYDDEDQKKEECGMIYGTDYKEVFHELTVMYGDDLIDVSITEKDAYAHLRFDPKHLAYITALIDEMSY